MKYEDNNQLQPISDQPAGVSLRYIVFSILNRIDDSSMKEYRRLMQIAIECVQEEMRLYHAASIEVFYGKVNEHGILQMPPDCVDWIKIGFQINGQLYNLAVNDNMVLNRGTKCGVDVREMIKGGLQVFSPLNGYYYTDHFSPAGRYMGGLYGLGGGFSQAVYRWDKTMNRFQIDGNLMNQELIVEYKSSGISAGTIIERELVAPVRNYVRWHRIEDDPLTPRSEKDAKQDQYEKSVEMLRSFRNRMTMREFLDTKYRTSKQTIKR